MKLKRLSIEDLKLNHPLPWNVYDVSMHLLLCKGYVVTSESQIEALLERGMFVGEDEYRKWQAAESQAIEMPFNPFSAIEDVQTRLSRLLKELDKCANVTESVTVLASALQGVSDKDADVGVSRILQMDGARYAVSHMIHVAFVAELVGKRLGWSAAERQHAMCAAMTMNVAMVDLQHRLQLQREPLTEQQRQDIHTHPIEGYEKLQQLGVSQIDWLHAVRDHHETRTGRGYPRGGNDSSEQAELLRLADVYCAKVSRRAYRRAVPPNKAAGELFMDNGQQGGNPLAAVLIKEVGIYPPGSFVQLGSGEVAVVARRGESANTPLAYALANDRAVPYVDPIKRDTSRHEFKIVSAVSPETVMVRVNQTKIWGYVD